MQPKGRFVEFFPYFKLPM